MRADVCNVHQATSAVAPGQVGLLASSALAPGTLVLSLTQPLLTILGSNDLSGSCANCLRGDPTSPEQPSVEHRQAGSIKACTGCKTVRYCSKVRGDILKCVWSYSSHATSLAAWRLLACSGRDGTNTSARCLPICVPKSYQLPCVP